jgi:4,5-dihydroxyphthalate decarboxylase
MSDRRLTLAIADYDRVAALADGRVTVPGVELELRTLAPSETFYRMLHEDAFDVSEMSLSSFLIAREQGREWTAIPVFPNRTAFHTSLFVHERSGIQSPEELRGKRIGLPEYQMTAAVWTRGALAHDFGVDPTSVEWFIERRPELSHGGETGFRPAPGIRVSQVPEGETLHSMLVAGEVEAVMPSPYPGMASRLNRTSAHDLRATPGVRRLFADPWAEAVRTYRKHGFLHCNHTVVVQNRHLEQDPDLAMNLFLAFSEAKRLAYDSVRRIERSSLLMAGPRLDEQQEVFGDDPFPYGFESSAAALRTLAGYSHEQGLTSVPAVVENLFASSTLAT